MRSAFVVLTDRVRSVSLVFGGFVLGVGCTALLAQSSFTWTKDQVVPVVLVKPFMGDFVAKDDAMQSWSRREVVPMVSTRPDGVLFKPESDPLDPGWGRGQVKPVVLVKAEGTLFVPVE